MNTFLSLGAVLCLGIFGVVLLISALAANALAGVLARRQSGKNWLRMPAFLFFLRMFPIAAAGIIALGFALPAFLRLEPRQTHEAPEWYLLMLASMSVAMLAIFAFRLIAVCWRTILLERSWRASALRMDCDIPVPVFRLNTPACLFAVIGIFRPSVFIGGDALACLEQGELRAAMAHEVAHIRSFDNLKRLLLFAGRLPGIFSNLSAVDSAWQDEVERQADEKALRSQVSVLDLSSAVVKIARLQSGAPVMLPTLSHLVNSHQSSPLTSRLQRLRCLVEAPSELSGTESSAFPGRWVLMAIFGYLALLPLALSATHRAMEWMVR